MLAIILAAALSTPALSPEDWSKAQAAKGVASVRRCTTSARSPDACLEAARRTCVADLVELGGEPRTRRGDPLLESACAGWENAGWEALRLEVEAKLEADLAGQPEPLAFAVEARRAWEAYREPWCEGEGWLAPTALTGGKALAREACRKALTQDRLVRVRQMTLWLND